MYRSGPVQSGPKHLLFRVKPIISVPRCSGPVLSGPFRSKSGSDPHKAGLFCSMLHPLGSGPVHSGPVLSDRQHLLWSFNMSVI